MTDDELEAIEARIEAATPGPWDTKREQAVVNPWLDGVPTPNTAVISRGTIMALGSAVAAAFDKQDGEFIAHACTDIPVLVAEVRRLREYEGRAFAQEAQLTKVAAQVATARAEALREYRAARDVAIENYGDWQGNADIDRAIATAPAAKPTPDAKCVTCNGDGRLLAGNSAWPCTGCGGTGVRQ